MSKKITSIQLDMELYNQLKDILRRENMNFTEWVHHQAKEYIKRHGAGNPATPLTKWQDDPSYVACPTVLEMEGFNWKIFDYEDLTRIEQIMIKERQRIYSIRRNKE